MADKPVTREEKYLAYLTGDYTGELPKPITRKEKYLYELCLKGMGGEISPEEIKNAVNEYLEKNPVKPGATTEQAQQIEQNKTDIAALKEDLSNKITKFYASNQGETHITDSDNGKIQDMMLYGKSEQNQYKGINLLPTGISKGEIIEVSIPKGTRIFWATDGTPAMGGNFKFYNEDKTQVMWLGVDAGKTTMTRTTDIDAKYIEFLIPETKLVKICLGIGDDPVYEPYTGGQPSPSPDYPQEIKSVVNPTVKVSSEDEAESQTVTLPCTLNAIPVSSGGNVTIDGQQYITDYVDVERGKLVKMVDSSKLDNTQSIVNKTEWLLAETQEIDLTTEEIAAFKALATYYPTTNISVNSEQLDGYTIFNYPTPFEDEWIKTKKDVDSLREDLSNIIDKQENLWTHGDVVNSYKANTQYQSKYYDIQLDDGEYCLQYDDVKGAISGEVQIFNYADDKAYITSITLPNKSGVFSPQNGGVRIYFFSTLVDVAEKDGVSTWSGIKLVKGTNIVNPSIKESALPKFIQNVKIAESFEIVSNTFSSGESLALKVSNSKSRNHIGFDATIKNMGKITIYYGKDMAFNDCKLTIDPTEVVAYNCTQSWVEMTRGNHGLVLSHHISVRIDTGNNKKAVISVTDETGKTYELQTEWVCGHGDVVAENKDGSYTKCKLTFYPSEYRQKVWAYGDSYFDLWPWICNAKGASHWMIDGFSGRGSTDALKSLKLALKHATPSIVLWCLGMNDPDTETEISASWLENIKKVKAICDENNITLIPTTIPNVPTRNHSFKNAYVRENFSRYVDISESLGAETSTSWYSGLLPDGDIHPSDAGRVLIAQKVMCEVPEII